MFPASRSLLARFSALAVVWGGVGTVELQAEDASQLLRWVSPELRKVDQEQRSLEETLATLPPAPERHLTERLGYHSGYSRSPETIEWVEVDLKREEKIDAVALIAAASNSGDSASAGYGFPVRFRVELRGAGPEDERVMLADYTGADFPNPGALPVYLPTSGQSARFVRVTATRLFREDQRSLFALGEIMVLQGPRDIALRAVRLDFAASRSTGAVPVWGLINLVDGHSVIGPPVGTQPSPTLGYQSKLVSHNREPMPAARWVQVDLGAELPIDEVRVFPAHPPEFAHRPGFGFPPELTVEISNDPNFNEPIGLRDFDEGDPLGTRTPLNPGDNPATYLAKGERARYVRFTARRLFNANGQYNLALAELQVWSGGKNVALGQPVTSFNSVEDRGWSRAALTDGFTSQANIVDWAPWLAGLSRRREIEHRLSVLDRQRTVILERWKQTGWWVLGGSVLAALVVVQFSLRRQRRARRAEMEALRQRISRDLHDEIGSSLGSIALISQEVIATADDPAQVRRDATEIQAIARQTVDSMRDIARLVQSETYSQGDLTMHLREIAARMLRSVPHTLKLEAAQPAHPLPVDRQRDLVLIFKEALHNIQRHAQASQVAITLEENPQQLTLTVRDDGRGFDPQARPSDGLGLANLRRRAEKHGGEVRVASAVGAGTTLSVTLPTHE